MKISPTGRLADDKLVVRGVSKTFTGRKSSVAALEGVDLHVDDGELVCLLGASGCGKSTLLSIIGGLEAPTDGEVRIDEELVIGPGADRGMVFQAYSLYPWLSVSENIEFGLKVARWPKAKRADRVQELLGIMSLTEFAKALPRELSGGMRQRVAIARALAPEPDVLLLDEPFGALDAQVRRELRDWLRRLHDEVHVTTVFVTHDQEEALEVSDEIVVINNGAVEQTGTPSELYDKPVNEFVMRFLGPVTHLGGHLVRPHDIDISLSTDPGSHPSTISRIQRVGFEVRVVAVTERDEDVAIQLTRGQADRLDLAVGRQLWLRASNDASVLDTGAAPVAAAAARP